MSSRIYHTKRFFIDTKLSENYTSISLVKQALISQKTGIETYDANIIIIIIIIIIVMRTFKNFHSITSSSSHTRQKLNRIITHS